MKRDLREANLPAFPVHVLGPVAGRYVEALSYSTQAAPDLAAMAVLGGISAIFAGRVSVRATPTWEELANLYTLAVAAPGESKTPTYKGVQRILTEIEKARADAMRQAVSERDSDRAFWQKRVDHFANVAAKATKNEEMMIARDMGRDARAKLDALPEIRLPRMLVDDITPEKLAAMLCEQRALTVFSTEGGLFATLAGRYNKGQANLDAFLKAWDGSAIAVDRKNGTVVTTEKAVLSVVLAVQPSVLDELGASRDMLGKGLTARFCYSIPPSKVGFRDMSRGEHPDLVDAERALRDLFMLIERSSEDSEDVSLSKGNGRSFLLTTSSRALWETHRFEIEAQSAPDKGFSPGVVGWLNKMSGLTLRLAAILQISRDPSSESSEIDEQVMRDAIELSWYFFAHAVDAFDRMTGGIESGVVQAEQMLQFARRWANDHPDAPAFSVRDAHQALRGRNLFKSSEAVKDAITYLVDYGQLIPAEPTAYKGRGQTPSPMYVLTD